MELIITILILTSLVLFSTIHVINKLNKRQKRDFVFLMDMLLQQEKEKIDDLKYYKSIMDIFKQQTQWNTNTEKILEEVIGLLDDRKKREINKNLN